MDSLLHELAGNFGGIEPRSLAAPIPNRRIGDRGISEERDEVLFV